MAKKKKARVTKVTKSAKASRKPVKKTLSSAARRFLSATKKAGSKKKAQSSKRPTVKSAGSRKKAAAPRPPAPKAFPILEAPKARKVPVVEMSNGSSPIKLHHRKPTPKEVKKLREVLKQRRAKLYGDVQTMENEAFSDATKEISSNHIADSSADQYEQDFTLHMIESETDELRMIELALEKIDKKTAEFGRCESCGIWISIERLRAKPFARICIHCIDKFEREGGGEHFGIVTAKTRY